MDTIEEAITIRILPLQAHRYDAVLDGILKT